MRHLQEIPLRIRKGRVQLYPYFRESTERGIIEMTESKSDGINREDVRSAHLSTTKSTAPIPFRPSRSDAAILDAAIDAILPEIEEWASGENVSDARDILRDSLPWQTDGYKLARAFERAGWDVDFQLADILNEADSKLYRAIDAATREWLADNRVQPKLALGAAVTLPPDQPGFHGANGEVTEIDTSRGTYTVFVASLGHVRKGTGTHGRIFRWEELEAVN